MFPNWCNNIVINWHFFHFIKVLNPMYLEWSIFSNWNLRFSAHFQTKTFIQTQQNYFWKIRKNLQKCVTNWKQQKLSAKIHVSKSVLEMYITSMLPSKVMPYLFRLAAPLMDSSIVQISNNKDGYHQQDCCIFWIGHLFLISSTINSMIRI